MWAKPTEAQARSVVGQIQKQGQKDCVLVSSECGGRVASYSLLLSLHSTFLASLLEELGEGRVTQGITLPLTLLAIRGIVKVLEGEGVGLDWSTTAVKEVTGQVVQEAADLLGIHLQGITSYNASISVDNISQEFPMNFPHELDMLDIKMEPVDENESTETFMDTNIVTNMGLHMNTDLKTEKAVELDPYLDLDPNLDSDPYVGSDTELYSDTDQEFEKKLKAFKTKNKILTSSTKNKMVLKGKFECEKCDYKTVRSHNLKAHILAIHEGARFNCNQCNFTASAQSNVITHIKMKHTNHPGYKCEVCEKKFQSNNVLKIHKRNIHKEVNSPNKKRKKLSTYKSVEYIYDEHLN